MILKLVVLRKIVRISAVTLVSRDVDKQRITTFAMSWCASGPGPVLRLHHVRTLPLRILRGKCDMLLAFSSTSRHTPKATNNTRSSQPGHSNYSTQLDLNGILNRMKERASSLSSATTLGLAEVGGRLTGYEHIEGLKRKVGETGAMLFVPAGA